MVAETPERDASEEEGEEEGEQQDDDDRHSGQPMVDAILQEKEENGQKRQAWTTTTGTNHNDVNGQLLCTKRQKTMPDDEKKEIMDMRMKMMMTQDQPLLQSPIPVDISAPAWQHYYQPWYCQEETLQQGEGLYAQQQQQALQYVASPPLQEDAFLPGQPLDMYDEYFATTTRWQ